MSEQDTSSFVPADVRESFARLEVGARHDALAIVPMMREGRVLFTVGLMTAIEGAEESLSFRPLAVIPCEANLIGLKAASAADMRAAGYTDS